MSTRHLRGKRVAPRDLMDTAAIRRAAGGITRGTLIRWRKGLGVNEPFPEPLRRWRAPGGWFEVWDRPRVKQWLEENRPT